MKRLNYAGNADAPSAVFDRRQTDAQFGMGDLLGRSSYLPMPQNLRQ